MTSDAMRQAKADLNAAEWAERRLQEDVLNGNQDVTAAELAEAEAEVRLAALRVQAVERLEKKSEQTRAEYLEEMRQKRVAKRAAAAKKQKRAEWKRGIESGAARRWLESFDQRPSIDPEYEKMLVEAGLLDPDPAAFKPTGGYKRRVNV